MKFSSIKFLFIICIFLFIVFNNAVFAQAVKDEFSSAAAVSLGCLIDVAPFGIEKYYLTVQAEYSFGNILSVGAKPLLAFMTDSFVIRLPLLVWLSLYDSKNGIAVYGYGGGGVEWYFSEKHNNFSPLLTGGIKAEFNWFYIDIPVAMAFREDNTDSDISINLGAVFKW